MDLTFFIVVFVLFDLVVLFYILFLRKKGGFSQSERAIYLASCKRIFSDKDLKRAVMEADKLLDLLLTKKGYGGPLGEKLKRKGELFSDLNGVWTAHKLRNRLAHELHADVSNYEAAAALKSFKKAYRDLGL